MRKNPRSMLEISNEYISKIADADPEMINNITTNFNTELIKCIRELLTPVSIINQEINSLILIASEDLLVKLDEQKRLIYDFRDEVQNCLGNVNVKDGDSFKILATIGHNERWSRFAVLNEEIITLMRKEINVE